MSAEMDPAKMKVVDLRNELAARGLDTKGNKPALVKRLKDAMESETDQKLPDTSIMDTTTEDLDDEPLQEEVKPPEKVEPKEVQKSPDKPKTVPSPKQEVKSQDPKTVKSPEKPKLETKASVKEIQEVKKVESPVKPKPTESATKPKSSDVSSKVEANGDIKTNENKEGTVEETAGDGETKMEEDSAEKKEQPKGEKRKRASTSPQRSQKRRSKSPIREDEPEINLENVQLNWYDSDLHLQVDKESFLSAKPIIEGAFGYAWAGVRTTHGVASGKVCYEVKITEELKWEDISKQLERSRYENRRNRDRRDRDRKRDTDRGKSKDSKPAGGKGKEVTEAGKEKKETSESEKKEDENKDVSAKKEDETMDTTPAEGTNEPMEVTEEVKTEPTTTDEKVEKAEDKKEETVEAEKTEEQPEEEKKEEKTETEKDAEKTGTEKSEEKAEAEKANEKSEAEKKDESEPIPTHFFRVGWSLVKTSLQLGEEKFSYAFESSGKFVTDKNFEDYGKTFGAGDVIGAFLDIGEEKVTIQYTVNGEVLPVAATIERSEFPEEENFALFPHILTRNYAFELNIGKKEEPWFAIPEEFEDYVFLSDVEDKVAGPLRPESRGECEVVLMCGLPGSGKTYWVKEHVLTNLEKRYTVLGNTSLLEKMTVSGEPLKAKYKGKWSILIDRIQKCLNRLISIAAVRRRNYIIDQTNVFPSAQRRKMRPFEGFKRKAVVIVVGDEEQARRQALQEVLDSKGVPDSTILEMKAAMSIPTKNDWMEEVVFPELGEDEANEQVKKYNEAGKAAGYSTDKPFKRYGRDRWQRRDFRDNYRNRSYQNRYDSRGRWSQRGGRGSSGGGGGWNRDRRDSRDWRGSSGGRRDRSGGRDDRSSQYRSGRDQGRWSGGGGGGWGGSGGGWNQQAFGNSGGYGSWGGNSGSGNWKYNSGGGQGYGSGGYSGGGGGWNYYGQYSQGQNWGGQKK